VNAAAIAADRNRCVGAAARRWRAAGSVGDETLAAVARLYPDDRVRFGVVMRLVLFVFALVAVSAAAGLAFLAVHSGAVLLVMGAALWAVTELLNGPLRFHGSGADEATSLSAVGYLCAGVTWAASESGLRTDPALVAVVGLTLALFAACAAARFGEPFLGGVASVGLAVAMTQAPTPRLAWLLASGILVPLLEHVRRSRTAAPSHRDASAVAIVVLAALAYFAANTWSVDARTLESLRAGAAAPCHLPRLLSVVLTALLPVAALAAGALRRDRMWLWLGAGMTAASAITVRHYVHIAPLWVLLAAAGVALGGLALWLQRWLDAGPSGERNGITARPLFGSRLREPAEIVAALATLAPAAREIPAEGGFKPGGGSFGGGGASDTF